MWKLFDYKDENGKNLFAEWTRKKLQKTQRIKLRAKLDDLAKFGPELPPSLLMKTEVDYIYKLKVQGNPKLRPMLCFGIFFIKDLETGLEKREEAFTLLVGAKEISNEFEPKDADIEAAIRREKILADPNRRVKHERID
ncbi:MAG TPA: hypothetical protein VN843_27950 [Anaerolineales bacterium]|nr:hypothetical protein [Anaerolineales bacterium]